MAEVYVFIKEPKKKKYFIRASIFVFLSQVQFSNNKA